MSGALGVTQMGKLDLLIEKEKGKLHAFQVAMKLFDFLKIQAETGKSSWFGFSMIVNEKKCDITERIGGIVFCQRNIECRSIVCGNIMRNEMIDHFDYSVFGQLSAADSIHDNG